MENLLKIVEEKNGKKLYFSKMLESVDELKELDITDEYQSACAVIFTLAAFEKKIDNAKEMFEFINGPENMSGFDLNFIKNQISQYPYVIRSYFEKATPENNYEISSEVVITIKENQYSRQEENYVQFLIHSNGADFDRSFKLRKKPSTGEWFIFSDTYRGLLAGIKAPKESDKWQ